MFIVYMIRCYGDADGYAQILSEVFGSWRSGVHVQSSLVIPVSLRAPLSGIGTNRYAR